MIAVGSWQLQDWWSHGDQTLFLNRQSWNVRLVKQLNVWCCHGVIKCCSSMSAFSFLFLSLLSCLDQLRVIWFWFSFYVSLCSGLCYRRAFTADRVTNLWFRKKGNSRAVRYIVRFCPASSTSSFIALDSFSTSSRLMYSLATKSANAARAAKRIAAGMATAASPIGDTKVPMSLLEPGKYINYQRIENNLEIVRVRYVLRFSD